MTFPSSRRLPWLVGLLGLLAVSAWLLGPCLIAWRHFQAGQTALERYHAEEALDHFDRYLSIHPSDARGHLLASRAARRAGRLDVAESHLRQCKRLSAEKNEELDLEWALLLVTLGDLDENESYLLSRAQRNPQESLLVQEALVEGYTRLYRVLEALRYLERWLGQQPENPQALYLRGNLYWQVSAPHKAVPDYRRVVEIDPEHHEARWRLGRCLAVGGGYDEALPLLEQTRIRRPNDPEVLVHLARCEDMLGRPARAREMLDQVLAEHTDYDLALRTRGQLELRAGRPAEAETWLRRALRTDPADSQASWLLAQALRRQGKITEADAQTEKAVHSKGRIERLGELTTRQMAEKPDDPDLHAELGALLIELGHGKVGENWLLSALRLKADHGRAHAALADYYQARGDGERAAFHRRQAPVKTGR
jgi:tetratricopeptide (TPR) repeat protein